MDDVLVLWDIDGTLLNADGVGRDLYDVVFLQLFGRSLSAYAPMAGRTDRAIILETLSLAGVDEPRRYVDPFIAGLVEHASSVRSAVADRGQALPGAAAVLATLAAARTRGSLAEPVTAEPASAEPATAPAVTAQPATAPAVAASLLSAPPPTARAAVPVMAADPAGGAGGAEAVRIYQSVLTGNVRSVAEVKLAALGLREWLDLCIGAYGDDHEDRTELVHVARRRAAAVHGRSAAAFRGTATVVIGDTPLDIAAALAAGARAVGVATGSHSADDLAMAGADAVLSDLTDTAAVLRALLP